MMITFIAYNNAFFFKNMSKFHLDSRHFMETVSCNLFRLLMQPYKKKKKKMHSTMIMYVWNNPACLIKISKFVALQNLLWKQQVKIYLNFWCISVKSMEDTMTVLSILNSISTLKTSLNFFAVWDVLKERENDNMICPCKKSM